MPFFKVVKGQDAYVEYEKIVEAETAEEATALAQGWEIREGDCWIPNGVTNEYDHSEIFTDCTEPFEADSLEKAQDLLEEQYASDRIELLVTLSQRDMILAALNLWITLKEEGEPDWNLLNDIATNADLHPALTEDEVGTLCEEINR